MYVLTDQASAETVSLVRDVLGKHVVLLVNSTGNVHGETHVNQILKMYLAEEHRGMKEVQYLRWIRASLRFSARTMHQDITARCNQLIT